jgi:large subunit ribosomal protein L17
MRHRKRNIALSRKRGPRTALVKGLVESLVLRGSIVTTAAKGRVVRRKAERLVTIGKENTLAHRRRLIAALPTAAAVKRILEDLGPKYKERPGGYTRAIKLGQRAGDGAERVKIEFV